MAILWGGSLLLAYDCLRLIRMFITHRRGLQILEEAVFWLAASFAIYTLIYRYNSGAVRNYVVFGMAVGMFFYRLCLSGIFIRISCFLLRPIRNLLRKIKTFLKNLEKRLKYALSRVKIRLRGLKHKKIKKQGD